MFIVYGCNHSTALEVREQIALDDQKARETLAHLLSIPAVNEAVVLSTCHRTELYIHTSQREAVEDWLAHYWPAHSFYSYEQLFAIQHLLTVASGVDSKILGESQILGQLKKAFALSRDQHGVKNHLLYLFQSVFSTTKLIRTASGIGLSPVSIAYMAVQLAKRIFSELEGGRVLLVGSGDTTQLVARHLQGQGVKRIVMASRDREKGIDAANQCFARWIPLSEIPIYLKETDIVISATSSTLPLIGKGMMETVLKARKHKPLLLIDLAVPRDIEAEVAELEDVYLYNVDDLDRLIQENQKARKEASEEAKRLVALEASHIFKQWQSLDVSEVICAYRNKIQVIQDACLEKALLSLKKGEDPEWVLRKFAREVGNKIMHHPSTQLKKAAYDGYPELLVLARQFWDL